MGHGGSGWKKSCGLSGCPCGSETTTRDHGSVEAASWWTVRVVGRSRRGMRGLILGPCRGEVGWWRMVGQNKRRVARRGKEPTKSLVRRRLRARWESKLQRSHAQAMALKWQLRSCDVWALGGDTRGALDRRERASQGIASGRQCWRKGG